MSVRVRFAPSPTGFLHIGGARTALFNWLFARANHGTLILRIEDTDRSRYVADAEADILTSLQWLGIEHDEGPGKGGPFEPYYQSQRTALYKKQADELLQKGAAYRCFCSPERLDQMRKDQEARKVTTGYDRHCRDLPAEETKKRAAAGERHVVRFKVPLSGKTCFHDEIRGEIEYENTVLDDLVLLKADGFPTYHLANVVDDHFMEITHVLRGDEWISSTPRHILLYQAFGWTPPKLAHLPLILAPDGGKLSKRHGATSVLEFRKAGYLPDALFNFLALLGFAPGNDREILPKEEMAAAFSLDKISAKGAVFDPKKLEWMNGQFMQGKKPRELAVEMIPLWSEKGWINADADPNDPYLARIVQLLQARAKRLTDLADSSSYFFVDPQQYEAKAAKKYFAPESAAMLEEMTSALRVLEPWDAGAIEKLYHQTSEQKGLGMGDLVHPSRLAVSGLSFGPGLFELMEALGKERSLRRMLDAAGRIRNGQLKMA